MRSQDALLLLLAAGCPDSFPPPGSISMVCTQACPRETLESFLAAQCESTEVSDEVAFVCWNADTTVVVYQHEEQLELPVRIEELDRGIEFAASLLDTCHIPPTACEVQQPN